MTRVTTTTVEHNGFYSIPIGLVLQVVYYYFLATVTAKS